MLALEDIEIPAVQDALRAWRDDPWTVAVVGRISAGKSTVVNAMLGEDRAPVGLGGVTRAAVAYDQDGVRVVDTPGIDAVSEALAALDPVLAEVDAVVWVVDGLQPVTRSERNVLELTLDEGVQTTVVVTKLDLVEPQERDLVLARVAKLTGKPIAEAGPALCARQLSSFNRDRRLREAVATTLASLPDLPPSADELLSEIGGAWRRHLEAAREATLEDDSLRNREIALRRFTVRASREREKFLEGLRYHPVHAELSDPRMPEVEPVEASTLRTAVGGLGGRAAAVKAVKAAAGRLLIDGQAVLADWVAPFRQWDDPEQRAIQESLAAFLTEDD